MSITLDETRDGEKGTIDASEYTGRLELLYEVAERASSLNEVSKLLEEILSITKRIIQASAASLFLVDEEEEQLYIQAAVGPAANMIKEVRLDLGSGIVGWVATHGRPLNISDVAKDSRFNKNVDKVTGFATRSVLAVPMMRGRKVIGVLEMLNKTDGGAFNNQDLQVLAGLASTEALILVVSMVATAITNIRLGQAASDGRKGAVEILVTASDARDPYAWGHSQRVKEYTLLGAGGFTFSPEEIQTIELGALLHDIGKIGVNEGILKKPGPLNPEEWYIVRKHPAKGASIVEQIPYLTKAKDIVLYHHERYDGMGYPEGLKGEAIPIGARLVAIADAFDTMVTDHSYRAALGVDEALAELTNGAGTQFCPVALEAFIAGLRKSASQPTVEDVQKTSQEIATAPTRETTQEAPDPEAQQATQEIAAGVEELANKTLSNLDSETYEGEVHLVFPSARFQQVKQFQESLEAVENLRVVLVGGSADEGALIVVSTLAPLALRQILKGMPEVENVDRVEKKGPKKLAVALKPSEAGHLFPKDEE